MTNLEIIKGLRACANGTECRRCPYSTESATCVNDLMPDTLDLITQRKAEVKELKNLCVSKDIIIKGQEAKIEALKMDNQQLQKDNFIANENADAAFQEGLNEAQDLYAEQVKSEAEAKVIEDFVEKLKDKIINTPSKFSAEKGIHDFLTGSAHRQHEILDYIDNLVKEMTEDKRKTNKKQVLEQIYELVKEFYGDCVSVSIFINSEGIECDVTEKPFVTDSSMKTINGKWLESSQLK